MDFYDCILIKSEKRKADAMKTNRIIQIFTAVILLIFLLVSVYLRTSVAPHTDDFDEQGRLVSAQSVSAPVQASPELPAETAAVPSEEEIPSENELSTEPDPDSPAGRAAALGLPAPPKINIDDWMYVLVNASHNVGESFGPTETAFFPKNVVQGESFYVKGSPDTQDWNHCQVDARIAEYLDAMSQACVAAGNPCYLSSGYRSYNEQNYLLTQKLNSYPYEQAITIVAPPGTSEHQTGLCVDITDRYYEGTKNESLEQTATYIWLRDNCTEYGFIVRYPKEKSGGPDSITGIMYEPWHFRYVGVDAAKYITENGLCLEEFVALYKPGTLEGGDG